VPNREIGFGSCVRASGRGEAKLHALARRCCFLRWGPGPEDVFRPAAGGRRPAAGRRPAVPRRRLAAGRGPGPGCAIQCNSMQLNAIRCNPMQFNAIQCNPMQSNAIQCNPMQSNAIPMQFQGLFLVAVRRSVSMQSSAIHAIQCNSKVCFSSRFVAVRRSVARSVSRRGSSQRFSAIQWN
jgi:hypothetical protein